MHILTWIGRDDQPLGDPPLIVVFFLETLLFCGKASVKRQSLCPLPKQSIDPWQQPVASWLGYKIYYVVYNLATMGLQLCFVIITLLFTLQQIQYFMNVQGTLRLIVTMSEIKSWNEKLLTCHSLPTFSLKLWGMNVLNLY